MKSSMELLNRFIAELGWIVALLGWMVALAFMLQTAADAEEQIQQARDEVEAISGKETDQLKIEKDDQEPGNPDADEEPTATVEVRSRGSKVGYLVDGRDTTVEQLRAGVLEIGRVARLEVDEGIPWRHARVAFLALGAAGVTTQLVETR